MFTTRPAPAPASGDHRPGDEEAAGQAGSHHVAEALGGHRPEWLRFGDEARVDRAHPDAGIVDQDVQAAQLPAGSVHSPPDLMLVPHVHADADGAAAQVPGSGPGARGVAAGDRYHRGGIEQGRGHSRPEPARTAGDQDPDPVRPGARSAHGPKLASRRNRGPVNDRRTPESVPALAEPARQPHAIADTRRRAANRHHDDAAHPNRPRARTRCSPATHRGLRRVPLDKRDPPFGAPTVSLQEFVCAAPNVAFCARKPMMSAAAAMSIQTCRATGTRRTRSLATLASIARCGRGSQAAAFSTPSPPG